MLSDDNENKNGITFAKNILTLKTRTYIHTHNSASWQAGKEENHQSAWHNIIAVWWWWRRRLVCLLFKSSMSCSNARAKKKLSESERAIGLD